MRSLILLALVFLACANPSGPKEAVRPEPNWCPSEAPRLDVQRIHSDVASDAIIVSCRTDSAERHGPVSIWNQKTGKIEELTFFDHGIQNGPALSWYDNGQLSSSSTYVRGRREGSLTMWHKNGELAVRSSFHGDKLDGLWEKYNEDGLLSSVRQYSNGELVPK